jgi:hypothetical protein
MVTRRERAQEVRRQRYARTASRSRPVANPLRTMALLQFLRRSLHAPAGGRVSACAP